MIARPRHERGDEVVDPDAGRGLVVTCRRPRLRTVDDLVAALLDVDGDDVAADCGKVPV